MREKSNNTIEQFPGQIAFWDLNLEEDKSSQMQKSLMKKCVQTMPVQFEKESTKQQEYINKNKIYGNKNLSRLIGYVWGWIGIEFKYENAYRTIYINKDGKEEFSIQKKSSVLPMDKVLYCENPNIEINYIQKELIDSIMAKEHVKRLIHRKGDENILIELSDRVISVLPNGWALDFYNISAVECSEDEILILPTANQRDSNMPNQKNAHIGDSVEVGDYVLALLGEGKVIGGKISRAYGMDHEILNIFYDHNTKATAIGRSFVIKILKKGSDKL